MRLRRREALARPRELAASALPAFGINGRPRGIEYAARLSRDVLVALARLDEPDDVKTFVAVKGKRHALETRWLRLAEVEDTDDVVVMACLPDESEMLNASPVIELEIVAGETRAALSPGRPSEIFCDLGTFVREGLRCVDRRARERLLRFFAATEAAHPNVRDRYGLSESLFALREALRERLPHSVISREIPAALHVDEVMAIDEHRFFARGWVHGDFMTRASLAAVSPEGARVFPLERTFRIRRPDVDAFYADGAEPGDEDEATAGFLTYFETETASRLSSGWVFQIEDARGEAVEAEAAPVSRDLLAMRASIVSELGKERRLDSGLMEVLVPAVSAIQERLERRATIRSVVQYGTQPADPDVSIVVPLYKRVDFLEHQLAQFCSDEELFRSDLIYVLDSPELAEGLKDLAAQLHEIYRVPFRLATMSSNGGFSAVNNRGSELARGRLLLLLNSDILPSSRGWLGKMADFYGSTPAIGALGPKLLFEDDSIQHAGLYFYKGAGDQAWENAHYYKGFHRSFPAANVARPVPAVTAACMMIRTDLYREVGGLRGIFVQGDYEDSDLCLRLSGKGLQNWYLPSVELYHLEGQSYSLESRRTTWRYNAWLHTRLWQSTMKCGARDVLKTPPDHV
jgi:GT2 family glycosyltransferase